MQNEAPQASEAIEVELLLSTPSTIVVRVQALDDRGQVHEDALVIRRRDCVGDRPRWRALMQAAAERVGRSAHRVLRSVTLRVDGRWHVLHGPVASPLQAQYS